MVLKFNTLPKSVPLPSYRHATPSGPWPWMDLVSRESSLPPQTPTCDHENCGVCAEWLGYPQSHFPNWTPSQVTKCKIAGAITQRQHDCRVYHVDVKDDSGKFEPCDRRGFLVTKDTERDFWYWLKNEARPPGLRVRALFVENLSGPVLQILGASYTIEPFFFSSSLNWIPSRYQENVRPRQGDHITVTLTFLRTMPTLANRRSSDKSPNLNGVSTKLHKTDIIDTQAPLVLGSGGNDKILLLDVLDLHLIRDRETSTIVSYHADTEWCMTTAADLQNRVRLIGESVYWQHIFRDSNDPTLLLVAIFWHALYAWDEALENLYSHIHSLEHQVIETNEMTIIHELHIISAHLLHYASLLEDFRKSVQFVLDTPNPAMDGYDDDIKERDRKLLEQECNILLSQIERLEVFRDVQNKRLKNVMDLVFSTIKLEDSQSMQRMTGAALRNSEAMTQLAYVFLLFRPADSIAEVFRMNVTEITPKARGTMFPFLGTTIVLIAASVWGMLRYKEKNSMTARAWSTFSRSIMVPFTRERGRPRVLV